MKIVFIKHFFVVIIGSEIPKVSVFGHCPYSVTLHYICLLYSYITLYNTYIVSSILLYCITYLYLVI